MGHEKIRRPILTPPNTSSIIYGVEAGGRDYSTTEQDTGLTWVDDTTLIYQKTIDLGTLPNGANHTVAHGISNFDRLVHSRGFAKNISQQIPLPYGGDGISELGVFVDNTNVILVIGTGNFSTYTGYITLWYTKTS